MQRKPLSAAHDWRTTVQLEASCTGTGKANMTAMDMRVENRENKLESNLRTAEAVDIGRRKEGESKKREKGKEEKGRTRQGRAGQGMGGHKRRQEVILWNQWKMKIVLYSKIYELEAKNSRISNPIQKSPVWGRLQLHRSHAKESGSRGRPSG